jgi:hypothetical protein
MDPTDTQASKDAWYFWTQLWPSLVVALSIYTSGVVAKNVAKVLVPAGKDLIDGKTKDAPTTLPLLFRLWFATLFAHPMLVGGLVALIPEMPRPEWVQGTVPAVAWFAFVGLSNGQVHMLVDGVGTQVRKVLPLFIPWARQKLGLPPATPTIAPDAPGSDPTPSTSTSLADTLEPGDEEKPK